MRKLSSLPTEKVETVNPHSGIRYQRFLELMQVDLRSEINAAIESMENPEERLLLKYRYLKNESWEDISYDLNVSYRTVHRIHASALNNFVVPE